MQVSIDVPDQIWAKAVDNAERSGVKLADVIVDAIVDFARKPSNGKPASEETIRRVAMLTLQGVTDVAMADVLSVGLATVGACRRHLGLPSNVAPRRAKRRTTPSRPVNGKLTDADVRSIREMCSTGATQVEAARRYGVTEAYVSMLIRGVRGQKAGV